VGGGEGVCGLWMGGGADSPRLRFLSVNRRESQPNLGITAETDLDN